MICRVSDFLVTLQELVAPYPPWVIACVGGVAIAIILILIAKTFKIAAVLFLALALGVGGWLIFRAVTDREPKIEEERERPRVIGAFFPGFPTMIAAVEQPLSCQRFPGHSNTRQ
jgi:hypothetical protein